MRRIILHISEFLLVGDANVDFRQVEQESFPTLFRESAPTSLRGRVPDGRHGDRPWRPSNHNYQSTVRVRVHSQPNDGPDIRDECSWRDFGCNSMAGKLLDRLASKPRHCSKQGNRVNRMPPTGRKLTLRDQAARSKNES
jgi:hypothetical protein